MSNNSLFKTFFVAIAVCAVCATLVSTANVVLRPIIEQNKLNFKRGNIVLAADLVKPGYKASEIAPAFEKIDPQVYDLLKEKFVTNADEFNPATFDERVLMNKDGYTLVPEGEVKPGVPTVPRYVTIYLVRNDKGELEKVILPFFGKGLWSTMYGFIALNNDFTTVGRLLYYDQLETAGLGGEVENPMWADKWIGKKAYDESGKAELKVIKGTVDPGDKNAAYKVDGISGATLTCKGVNNQIGYWLNEYRGLLAQLKAGQIPPESKTVCAQATPSTDDNSKGGAK